MKTYKSEHTTMWNKVSHLRVKVHINVLLVSLQRGLYSAWGESATATCQLRMTETVGVFSVESGGMSKLKINPGFCARLQTESKGATQRRSSSVSALPGDTGNSLHFSLLGFCLIKTAEGAFTSLDGRGAFTAHQ